MISSVAQAYYTLANLEQYCAYFRNLIRRKHLDTVERRRIVGFVECKSRWRNGSRLPNKL